eukprot:CAMPEP_0176407248 /NCGR_PEP_ID=MMETSP0127-20121128/1310_1 /TAXON_ID=938130 /ORGANISM="Platyophrya macrostoma, Strain WH" /LENGTH=99 /DNA_ID=CAMNT_0017786441 /DNA_START=648 /DNA_END=947 /DNA_ORIENTATION=-
MRTDSLGVGESTVLATLAAIASTAIVNPLDLVIVRHQISDSSQQHVSAVNILKEVVQKEGFLALFKGLSARTYYNIAFAILDIPLYEYFRREFGVDLNH